MILEHKNPEESFHDLFSKEDESFEQARIQRAKEARLGENLTKEIIEYIYRNIGNIRIGEKLDHTLANISPECQRIIEALEPFEYDKESPFATKKLDLFSFLVDYDKAKNRVKLKKQLSEKNLDKIMAELEAKQYGQPYKELALNLEILSAAINKDVVKDMISRNNLETKASKLIEILNKLQGEVLLYTNVWSEINSLMDKYGNLSEIKFDSADLELAEKIKRQLNEILDIELSRLENNEFEYGKMKAGSKIKYREKLLKIKIIKPEQIFDIDNFGFIGLLLENRKNIFLDLDKKYEQLNKRIEKYFL